MVPIEKVIEQVPQWKGKKVSFERLSDYFMWNANYRVEVDGKKFFVKVPGEKSELFFNRDYIHAAAKAAEKAGVGPAVEFYVKGAGAQVDRWIEGYTRLQTDRWIFQHRFDELFLFKSVDALKKIHDSGQVLPNKDNQFDVLAKLIGLMKKHETFQPRELGYLENLIDRIHEAIEANGGIQAKPTVNNINERWSWDFFWNADKKDMKIVDYEWACMDDVCADLATLSTSGMLYDDHDQELVEYYFGELDPFTFARFKLYKLLVCLKGCFFMAVLDKFRPVTFDYIRSYGWKMARFRALVRDPRTENYIWMLKNHKVYDQWKGYPV